jgi:TMEM175 potassium channel family protein
MSEDRKEMTRLPLELRPTNRRIEAFSDGVLAIVVTIMIFQIKIPDSLAFGNDRLALEQFGALIATYALSFVVIAILWGSHHYLIYTLPKADRLTIWLNNHVLFWITLIPLVARFLGSHPMSPRAAAAWAFVIMMCTISLSLLRLHAVRVSQNELHKALHRSVFRRSGPAIVVYAATIPLAFIDMRLVWICFVILPMLFILPVTRRGPQMHRTFAQDKERAPESAPSPQA